MNSAITWHRPEYRDQPDALISLVQVATLAGVTRAAVSNWRRRHDFPAPAVTAGRTVWVPRTEVEQWLAARAKTRPLPDDPIAVLEKREKRQIAALAATRKKLRTLREQTSN